MKTTIVKGKLLLFLFISLGCSRVADNKEETDSPLILAFGSCNNTGSPQVMWDPIVANDADAFIWLGDIVYGDTHDMSVLKSKYDQVLQEPGYQSLLQNIPTVIGVWDDHDYGWNDAGKHYSKKDSSKALLVDFLNLSEDDPVRNRNGMYASYLIGEHPTMAKVILLDARYFRDTVVASPDPARRYTINPDGDVLGEAQWAWLEEELTNSVADLHLIGSGIQVLPEEHGWEKWANFPKSRERLLNLISVKRPKNPLIISGDRHIAEFSKIDLDNDYPLYEVTSSGLTHTWSQLWEESNKYRIGGLIVKKNFGVIRVTPHKMTIEIRGEADSLFKSLEVPFKKR